MVDFGRLQLTNGHAQLHQQQQLQQQQQQKQQQQKLSSDSIHRDSEDEGT